jgi:hypothetical protein
LWDFKWEAKMKWILAALIVFAASTAFMPSDASAAVCRAAGFTAEGMGRAHSIERAKFIAMNRCARGALLHVCTITWCTP